MPETVTLEKFMTAVRKQVPSDKLTSSLAEYTLYAAEQMGTLKALHDATAVLPELETFLRVGDEASLITLVKDRPHLMEFSLVGDEAPLIMLGFLFADLFSDFIGASIAEQYDEVLCDEIDQSLTDGVDEWTEREARILKTSWEQGNGSIEFMDFFTEYEISIEPKIFQNLQKAMQKYASVPEDLFDSEDEKVKNWLSDMDHLVEWMGEDEYSFLEQWETRYGTFKLEWQLKEESGSIFISIHFNGQKAQGLGGMLSGKAFDDALPPPGINAIEPDMPGVIASVTWTAKDFEAIKDLASEKMFLAFKAELDLIERFCDMPF
jgi:hypothetical protein